MTKPEVARGKRIREWQGIPLTSVANKTKWERLRNAMCYNTNRAPKFRCMDLSGFYSPPDGEWHHHFRAGGYETLRYVDLLIQDEIQSEDVLEILVGADLTGHAIESGFRVYGYALPGEYVEKFKAVIQ